MVDGLLALAWGISATRFLTDEDVDADVETYLAAYAPPLLMAGSGVEGWRRVTRCNEFMLTPINSEEAAATYETYFRWRPPMLLPLVQPPLVPRESSALPVPSRLPAWFRVQPVSWLTERHKFEADPDNPVSGDGRAG